ncbi:YihY/virulence factor BrkB family protein [Ostreiculturibacter nitratireducens]|uniref:YihY/virulence factor BrkB family protein n=1 Tax=Ostreiculturibacter nitratireducens TaxID=3075226 RepID=UPI0031B58080
MASEERDLSRSTLKLVGALIAAVWNAADDRHLGLIAAGVAFYGLFAIFPGIAATIALWGYFSDPAVILSYLDTLSEFIPADAFSLLESQVKALVASNVSTLGWTSALSLLVALYSARAGVAALIQGLNAIYMRPQRDGLMRFLRAVLLTFVLIAVVLAALATVIFVPVALAFVPLGPVGGWLVTALPWIVLFIVVLGMIGMFYRYGPNRPSARGHWVSPGALLAALLWAGASVAFSLYLANFGTYNKIYGSIGAVVALLMWFYISAYTVLLGAAVNAELSRMLGGDQ